MSKVNPDPAYPPAPPPYQPAPAGGYPPGPPGQPSSVVVVQVVPGSTVHYREQPVRIQCQHCHAQVITSTSYSTGTFAWLIAGLICILGFWFFCCLIPFCIDGCKDVIHTCPNCGSTVGRYNRL